MYSDLILTLFRLVSAHHSKVLNSPAYVKSALKFGDMMSLRNRSTEDLIAAEIPHLQLNHYRWEKHDQQETQIERDTPGTVGKAAVESHILDYEIGNYLW